MERTVFWLLLLAGIVILTIGIVAFVKRMKYNDPHSLVRGTAEIIGHDFTQTVPTPVLRFAVDGREYKIRPRYKMVSGVRTPTQGKPEFTVDGKGRARYRINSFMNDFRPIANELYPVGSEVQISYNKQNPRFAVVPGFAQKGSVSNWVFIVVGISVIIISVFMYIWGIVK